MTRAQDLGQREEELNQIGKASEQPPSIDAFLSLLQLEDPRLTKEELKQMSNSQRKKLLRRLQVKSHPDNRANFSMKGTATAVHQTLMDFYDSCMELPIFQEDSNSDLSPFDSSSFDQRCEAAKSEDPQTRQAAYEFLSEFVKSNYKTLTQQDIDNLVACTSIGIRQHKEVAAIDLWMDICEIEQSIIEKESGDYKSYVSVVLTFLAHQMTNALINDDDFSEAAAMCLTMISQIVKDSVIHFILPFVQQHIKSENWRFREAATMAFCSILDGTSTAIGPHVNWIIPFLLEGMNHPHEHDMVKDTSLLTIAEIFKFHFQAIPPESFPNLVKGLMSKLSTGNPSSISANAAYAIHNLALAFVDNDQAGDSDTNALSPYMEKFFEKLSRAALPRDADTNKLRSTAFHAMSALVQVAAPDCSGLLERLLEQFLVRLHYSLLVPQNEIEQRLVCILLNEILISINAESISVEDAEFIIDKMIKLLEKANNPECYIEAFSVLSEVCGFYKLSGENVARICEQVKLKLNNNAERVCIFAVELVSNVAHYSEGPVALEFAKLIMGDLLESLYNENVHDSVKPHVLTCIGDIARAVGRDFQPYLEVSMTMLMQASHIAMQNNDDCSKQLLEGVLDGYIGIVNGLGKEGLLHTYKPTIDTFLAEAERYPDVTDKALALKMDLCDLV